MNEVYNKALEGQRPQHGAPIFFANIKFHKVVKHGNSIKVKHEKYEAKGVVCAGTVNQIKADKFLLKRLITDLSDHKTATEEMTKARHFIDEIEILKFLGYSQVKI